ncbi:MAG: hypothetical protein K2H20_01870, partial [Bacilli bacterium]|nr:hypothetical protein [Bacilli bacterium]
YEDGIDDESHTFLTYKEKEKYYWFEHAWMNFKGIHEYDTMNELVKDVKEKFMSMLGKDCFLENCLHCYIYDKPKESFTVERFYEHCENGVEVKL